jgi:hypothetical protein
MVVREELLFLPRSLVFLAVVAVGELALAAVVELPVAAACWRSEVSANKISFSPSDRICSSSPPPNDCHV